MAVASFHIAATLVWLWSRLWHDVSHLSGRASWRQPRHWWRTPSCWLLGLHPVRKNWLRLPIPQPGPSPSSLRWSSWEQLAWALRTLRHRWLKSYTQCTHPTTDVFPSLAVTEFLIQLLQPFIIILSRIIIFAFFTEFLSTSTHQIFSVYLQFHTLVFSLRCVQASISALH